jgi:Superfamily I DNA and RNA helicases
MTLNYDITGEEEYGVSESVKIDGSAGTGKSTQILLRTEKFLKQNELTISDICLVTYRNSLAEDIIDRFREEELVSEGFRPERSNIGTMHAICNRLIRNQTDIDVSNKVSWYEKKLFCNQVGLQYNGSHKRDRTGGKELFRTFSWLLANKKPPEELPQSMYDDVSEACEKNVDIRRLWGEWKQFKQNPPVSKVKSLDSGDELFDFDELLLLVEERNLVPEHAEMVIVDEMHDVYPAMYDVIRMWMDEMDDTTFVIAGDKHQVITEYLGATPRFYESIELPEIKLPISYRCPESHVEYSHQVLSNYYSPPDIDSESSAGQLTEIRGARMQYQSAHDNWRITQKRIHRLNCTSSMLVKMRLRCSS